MDSFPPYLVLSPVGIEPLDFRQVPICVQEDYISQLPLQPQLQRDDQWDMASMVYATSGMHLTRKGMCCLFLSPHPAIWNVGFKCPRKGRAAT